MSATALFVLGILFLTVVLPLWIVFHYITKWKSMKGLSAEDERMLADLWDSANRIEQRIVSLEKATGTPGAAASETPNQDRPS